MSRPFIDFKPAQYVETTGGGCRSLLFKFRMFVFNYMYLRKKAFSCKGVVIPDAETRVRTLFPHRSGLLRPETFFTRLFFFFF